MKGNSALIADLLMGAAHADSHLDGRELETVKQLLAKIMGEDELSAEMGERVKEFDPSGFDPVAVVRELGLETDGEKRHLIELVAAVHDADEELDFSEHEYLERVAKALGLPPEAYGDLSLEILSMEHLAEAGADLIKATPPPIPKQ